MQVNQLPQIITEENITVVYNGKVHSVNRSHFNYDKIIEMIKDGNGDADELIMMIDTKQAIKTFSQGYISIDDTGIVRYKDTQLHNSLTQRMVTMLKEGFSIVPLVNFLENVMQNPSRSAVQELYEFLERNSLPLTSNGTFLAYKRVRDDYMDYHTGTMNNSLGQELTVERNSVDDNRENTCSYGLHFCSLEYLSKFHSGCGHIMIVEINPKDVVSFPKDYNISKGRTCSYKVVGEHELDEKKEAFNSSVCIDYDNCASCFNDDDYDNENDSDDGDWEDNY